MKWPRDRYNGKRIVGVEFKVQLDVTEWRWLPWVMWRHVGYIHWLWFHVWITWSYE